MGYSVSMLRILLVLLAAFALTSATSAQIYALEFKDPKHTKSYKKHLYEWNGRKVVLVEIRGGFDYDAAGNRSYNEKARLEFFVQDPADPTRLPYVLADGGVKKANKRQVIGVAAERFGGLTPFMLSESFYTLSVEYQRRLDSMATARSNRAEAEKGSRAWFAFHNRLVMEMEGLQLWLKQTGYIKAANKLSRDLLRESKLGAAAKDDRLVAALESVKKIATPDSLKEAAKKVGGDKLKYHVQESKHVRMIYNTSISDGQAMVLMALAEKTIEVFRVAMVDPYLDEQFVDKIPDDPFMEFFFSGENAAHHEKMYEDYYGYSWGEGEERQRRLKSRGASGSVGKLALAYWRFDETTDFEGIVVHSLGHALARHHYTILGDQSDWLEEGAGYYLSFNLLNRNNVTCSAFKPPTKLEGTVSKAAPGSKKTKSKEEPETRVVMKGLREVMAGVALHAGTPMNQLAPKQLFAFQNEDMAKSWAFFAFIVDQTGKEGQVWLRGISKLSKASGFQKKLRLHTEECFADIHGDAMTILEQRWKEYLKQTYKL
jgi:hypothetical protein